MIIFEGLQVLARSSISLYHVTFPCIRPVKQLELLDLISQTDAVTLRWQIKIQINLPCVKKGRESERRRERVREWKTLNTKCHHPLWNFNNVNSQFLPTE